MVLVEEPPNVQGLPRRSVLGENRPNGSGVFRRYRGKPVRMSSETSGCDNEFDTLMECIRTAEKSETDGHSFCSQYRLQYLQCMRKEKIVTATNASRRYNYMRVLNSYKKLR